MRYTAREVWLRDGRKCVVRSLTTEDAAQAVAFLCRVLTQSPYLVRLPEEQRLTPQKEAEILESMLESPRSVMIGAFVEERLVGTTSVSGLRDVFKMRHRAGMGITVDQPYWHLGVGTAMMQAAIDSARQMGYAQLELGVFADNARAIALYERFGFETWGRMKNAFRQTDGTCCDEIMMGLMLR